MGSLRARGAVASAACQQAVIAQTASPVVLNMDSSLNLHSQLLIEPVGSALSSTAGIDHGPGLLASPETQECEGWEEEGIW